MLTIKIIFAFLSFIAVIHCSESESARYHCAKTLRSAAIDTINSKNCCGHELVLESELSENQIQLALNVIPESIDNETLIIEVYSPVIDYFKDNFSNNNILQIIADIYYDGIENNNSDSIYTAMKLYYTFFGISNPSKNALTMNEYIDVVYNELCSQS